MVLKCGICTWIDIVIEAQSTHEIHQLNELNGHPESTNGLSKWEVVLSLSENNSLIILGG